MTNRRAEVRLTGQGKIRMQCVACGAIMPLGHQPFVDCPRCGALDYHVFRGNDASPDLAAYRPAPMPDNKDVINQMISLVERKTR
ncbi:MAG: hypothetical protein ACRD3E_10900 [Terriglobales bacterium]